MKGSSRIPDRMCSWLIQPGNSDIVISSRIRLARNLSEFPFPGQSSQDEMQKIRREIASCAGDLKEDLTGYNMENLSSLERQAYMERHLISKNQSQNPRGSATFINEDQTISIMVNEEDHLRMQFLASGEQLSSIWKRADNFDDRMEEDLNFAFSGSCGYLTACPTNLGTGLRASLMLHLPGLSMTDNIEKLLGGVGKFGLAVRGIFGEGSEVEGSIFQLSNQVTLGVSEQDIIENLYSISRQVIEKEKEARENLLKSGEYEIKDRIMRAFGILKYAYKINKLETVHFVSLLLMGDYYGMFSDFSRDKLLELLVLTRPAHLQLYFDEKMNPERRKIFRAKLIKDKLSGFKFKN